MDFTEDWSNEDFKKFREYMISIILSTDMTTHFSDIAKVKSRLASSIFSHFKHNYILDDFNLKDKNDKLMCLDSIVHASDISNPAKEWSTYFNWTNKVMEEFWV